MKEFIQEIVAAYNDDPKEFIQCTLFMGAWVGMMYFGLLICNILS